MSGQHNQLLTELPPPVVGESRPIAEVAISYAERGWPVLPVRITKGVKLREDGKPHSYLLKKPVLKDWPNTATTDPEVIRSWRCSAFGILTGSRSKLVVIDVDPRNGGLETLASLPQLPETLTHSTISSGFHLIYQYDGPSLRTGKNRLGDGVDVKAEGGYIVGPPSSGYAIRRDMAPAMLPEEIAELIRTSGGHRDYEDVELGKPEPFDLDEAWFEAIRQEAESRTEDNTKRYEVILHAAYRFAEKGKSRGQALFGLMTLETVKAKAVDEHGGRLDSYGAQKFLRKTINIAYGKHDHEGHTCKAANCEHATDELKIKLPKSGEPIDQNAFFHKGGLLVTSLLKAVEDDGPLAVDHARNIYRYNTGVWAPDGESEVRRRIAKLLQDKYRIGHAANVLDIVKHRNPWFDDASYDTRYLNLPNGLLNWRTGELIPHDPNIATTIRIPVDWDESATCPAIDNWLAEVFDEETVELAVETIGYCLFNDNPLHKAMLLFGTGRNGKGTYLRLIRALIGDTNITAITPQSLDDNRFRSAELYGKLANLVGDVDARIFKATEVFKQITGGDLITAERKHGQPFNFRCRATMIAAFNKLPQTTDTTDGFFSRWVVVPFNRKFDGTKADPNLIEKLTAEAELQGLLVKAVKGLRNLMARGHFRMTPAVEEATRNFRYEADPVRTFVKENLNRADENWMPRSSIYLAFVQWSQDNGIKPLSANEFYGQLNEACRDVLGLALVERKRGVKGFVGISLEGN